MTACHKELLKVIERVSEELRKASEKAKGLIDEGTIEDLDFTRSEIVQFQKNLESRFNNQLEAS